MIKEGNIRAALSQDLPRLHEIRRAAFEPVFESFKNILGDNIYAMTQAPNEQAQKELLDQMVSDNSEWPTFVYKQDNGIIVGFVSMRLNHEKRIGEIGLNAVHPDYSGQGVGTEMYEFILQEMKYKGMKLATVGTGADASHDAARKAYAKAGFETELPSVWLCKLL